MKFKVFFFIVIMLLLNCGLVGSQSLKGLLTPGVGHSNVLLPQSKSIQQVNNNKDTQTYSRSYTIPKGYLLPKQGRNNTFLPQKANNSFRSPGTTNNNSVSSGNTNNIQKSSQATEQQNIQNQTNQNIFNDISSGQSGETVDTSGFSRIPTLETNPVPDPVSTGLEQVDTARLLVLKSNPTVGMVSSRHFTETVDTARLLNLKNNPSGGIETATHSIETVDTATLLKMKKSQESIINSHFNRSSETVDTATFIARLKPVINKDSLDFVNNKPKPVYKSQTISGTIMPEKGKNNMYKPLEINTDTTKYLAPLPTVKETFDFPGSDKYPATSKGIGELNDLLPSDTVKAVVSNPLGELAEIIKDGSLKNAGSTATKSPEPPKVDEFYKFEDGTIYYDTSKVLTNTKGRSFTGSLISKPGKSSVLQPSLKQDDIPAQVATNTTNFTTTDNSGTSDNSTTINDTKPVENTKNTVEVSKDAGTTVSTNNNTGNSDDLKATFYLNQAGKITVCFSCNGYYINVTQWGYISDYVFKSVNKKDKAKNTTHKNPLGLVDNIGGSAIEYTDEHLITLVGTWPVKYTFDNMIASVGDYKISYNSFSSVKRIDKYKINYDFNKSILNVDDSGGLIIVRTEDKKK